MPSNAFDTLNELARQRFSCRAFLADPVPQAVIEQIVGLAQRAASWCNAQPWQLSITRGAATERFRQAMMAPAEADEPGPDFAWPEAYQGVYLERRRECGYGLYDAVGIARGDRAASARQAQENFRFFGAPHVAIVTSDAALGPYGAVDCGGFVAQFMLAATSLGVASIAQAALASRPQRVREALALPPDRRVVCGISFGYADTGHPANSFRTRRAEVGEAARFIDV